ncbi:MAG: ABC transporter permease [Candidatus Tectomicrobia bacterium]|uniref:ABC transporter permease n=1 Tax=Tectimicrobiota bacterium TaxID=2528274 RepID=A0A932MM96_UNCTE|nr:ABC transporter permease [Candidatus Tectomicrobia bacterium]
MYQDEEAAPLPMEDLETDAPAQGPGRRGLDLLYPIAFIVLIIAAWEAAVVWFRVQPIILPPPSAVVRALSDDWWYLLWHTWITGAEVVLGFLASALLGVPAGVLIVWSKTLERTLMPIFVTSQTIPKIAIAPLFVIWFGIGLFPKVLVSLMIAFFPIVISTSVGLKAVDKDMIDLIQSMNASKWQVFQKVRIPNSLPFIFSGLKIATAFATVGAVVGEFVGADKGLGYVLIVSNSMLETPRLFATLVPLSLIGIVLYAAVVKLEKVLIPWDVAVRGEERMMSM